MLAKPGPGENRRTVSQKIFANCRAVKMKAENFQPRMDTDEHEFFKRRDAKARKNFSMLGTDPNGA
jgi:hypothetical protein